MDMGEPGEVDLARVGLGRARALRLRRALIQGGYEILEVPLPCVVSVKTACNEPRFMDPGRIINPASVGEVTTWTAADLALNPEHIGLPGSPTTVADWGCTHQ